MRIGGRKLGTVLRAPFHRGHWRAMATMPRVYRRADLTDIAGRFLLHRGTYPYVATVRTPVGVVHPTLDRWDDLLTVNEIFARRDYEAPETLRVAVDVGANIGIASLYFLTRNTTAKVYAIEPDPKNAARIPRTLADFAGRYELQQVAASDADGTATFYVEETGRYGGLDQTWQSEEITVPTRSFTDMLDEILAREERIDVLKIDTEGSEQALVASILPHQLERIDRIYYETDEPAPLHEGQFRHAFDCQTNALIRVGQSA
jgi:FkbM family methyltransferase